MGGAAEDRDGGGRVASDTAPRDSGARELAPQSPRVFISYSHDSPKHRERVVGLAERLRQDGIDADLDQYVNGTPAEGWPRWMLDRLEWADRVLVVCTETYHRRFRGHEDPGKGKGVDFEGVVITNELYTERSWTKKFVPVLYEANEGTIPEPLRGYTHYRLTSKQAYDALYNALLEQSGVEPGEVGPPKRRDRRRAQPARFPSQPPPSIRSPTTWNIPEARNHHFTGRDDLLEQLRTALTQRKTGAVTQAVRGLGGVGKTQLALEYAYRFAGEYEGVWWLHAEDPLTLARDYVDLAPKLGLPEFEDQAKAVREVRDQLRQRQRFLLVFDNATEPKTLRPYLPVGLANHVIITTRAHTWQGSRAVEVHEFALDVAIAFLLDRTGQGDRDAAEEIAKRLGCLPLALEQAAAYVGECDKRLADYARLLREDGLELLEDDKSRSLSYEKTVGTTWNLAFKEVRERCPAAADLLNLCAFFGPEAIHLGELRKVHEMVPEPLSTTLAKERELDDARAALLRFSLIRVEGSAISIHRLVQEVTRQRLGGEDRDRWLGAALRVLNGLVPEDSHDVRTWPECARWIPHALTAVNWDGAEDLDPGACSRILDRAGTYYWVRADYAAAEPMFRRALTIREASLGPNHSDVAESLNNLANLLSDTNRHSEAEPLYRRALAIDEARYGPDHPEVATDLNNLALLLRATNRPDEAERMYRRALAIRKASLDSEHPDVAQSLNNLAGLLRATNRLDEAEAMYRRALAISEASLGPDHPTVAIRLGNLAGLLEDTNRLDEAEPLYRRALAIHEESLGRNHPHVATGLNNLALLLSDTNRYSEAEPLYRRALAIWEASLGPEHPNVGSALNNLATLLRDTNRPEEAEPLYRRAVRILETSLGDDHPRTVAGRRNLEILLEKRAAERG